MTTIRLTGHMWTTCWYLFVQSILQPDHKQMTPLLLPAQLPHWLPSVSPYIMSHMHLGSFSLTHLVQHCVHQTDTHELDVFCTLDCLNCCAMGHLLHSEQYLLDQHVIIRVSHLQQLWSTLHLHTTRVIFVIQVGELLHSLIYLITRASFLLVQINVRFANLECVMRCIQCLPRHFLASLYVKRFIYYYEL